jgi:hypothetical protein
MTGTLGSNGQRSAFCRMQDMAKKPERKPDDPEQYKRFLEAAKEAEADETEKGADKAFRKVAKPTRRQDAS